MTMVIPDEAVPYILFQRTRYLIVQNNRWLNSLTIRIPFLTYQRIVRLEAFLFGRRVKRLFNEDMRGEYETMKPYLPPRASAILDIGCGVAGIDVLLARHYHPRTPDLYLLDKTQFDENVYYGLEPEASYYNSLAVAKSLLVRNGIPPDRIHLEEVRAEHRIGFQRPFDVVVSLRSWGFHYPLSMYLEQVWTLLKPGGMVIVDIRKGSAGEEALADRFRNLTVIAEAQKHRRILARKRDG